MTIKLDAVAATTAEKTGIARDLVLGANAFRPQRNMVVAMVGDSNTDAIVGRPGWQYAVDIEWKGPGGIFEGATVYNNGANGSQLNGWVANIVTKADSGSYPRDPANYGTANPWDVVDGDPDLIIISLMTNDLNTPANRSGVGTEANLRANLKTLVEFFLENTTAIIWLRMPQPFHWGETTDAFDYLTLWTNDADCQASTELMRTIHLEWVGQHPRVMVYDSHKHLFGLKCDDKSTDCQDPDSGIGSGGALIDDGLHCTNLGFRRIAQQMAEQWSGISQAFDLPVVPLTMKKTALWARDYHVVSATATAININLEQELILTEATSGEGANTQDSVLNNESSPVSRAKVRQMKAIQDAVPPTIYQELLSTGADMKIYFHVSGNSYTFTKASLSSYVDATDPRPDYAVITLTGVSASPAAEVGRCTIWTDDINSMPFAGMRLLEDIELVGAADNTRHRAPQGIDQTQGTIYPINYITFGRSGTGNVTFNVSCSNLGDGRYVLAPDNYATGDGKPIAEVLCTTSSGYDAGRIILRTDLWPDGILLNRVTQVTTKAIIGTNNKPYQVRLSRRGGGVFPTISVQPVDTAISDGADMVLTCTNTGGIAYQWQESSETLANAIQGLGWTDISGATSGTGYTKSACTLADSGKHYRLLIRYTENGFTSENALRYISSNIITLTVS